MKAIAVIGLNHGDEGKGLMTDYLADKDTLVVRYNGGAQAGHTVITPNGRRHEFHHIGAGTFQGATTFLSRFFLVNPALFKQEYHRLADLQPTIIVDQHACVTLPFDMLLGRIRERILGHGSVGLGINETVERSNQKDYRLEVGCFDWKLIDRIRDEWIPQRVRDFGGSDADIDLARGPSHYQKLIAADWTFFAEHVQVMSEEILRHYPTILFEGAQGLGLDAEGPDFPHVTRSRTGLPNIVELCKAGSITDLKVHYVTRGYLTRHGAGPMAFETEGHPFNRPNPEETNQQHEWQGSFRYGHFDLPTMKERMDQDLLYGAKSLSLKPQLAVTCLDQMPEDAAQFQLFELMSLGLPITHTSYGPKRSCVRGGNVTRPRYHRA